MVILICFKKSNILKKIDAKLKEENNIEFDKESNGNWYNYRFNDKNINMISYYIIYFNLKIQNEEFFIKQYFKLNKSLTENEKSEYMQMQFKRFGK